MPTIKNHFSNMYGDGKNLNVSKNKTVNALLNNIPNIKVNSNAINKNELNKNELNKNVLNRNVLNKNEINKMDELNILQTSTSGINISYILIILFIVIIGVGIYFKDIIIDHYNKFMSTLDTNAKTDTNKKIEDTSNKIEDTSKKVEDTNKKIDDLDNKLDTVINQKDCQPAINKLNTKLGESSYTKEQTANENGFCYIGYDNGQRDCIDIYAGDVCMSGQIFSSLDICINPKLRP